MGTLRNLAEYIRYDLEYNLKTPLRKDGSVVLGTPKAPSEFGITDTAKNTGIAVEFDHKAFVVLYNRVDVSEFLTPSLTQAGGLVLTVNSVKTTRDLVFDLNRALGLELRVTDVVDAPVTILASTTSVQLTLSPECLWFTGSLTVPLKGSYEQQGEALVQILDFDARPFVATNDPTGASYQNGGLLTYGTSYAAQTAALAAIPATATKYSWENVSAANGAALAAALKAVDGLEWNYDGANFGSLNLAFGCVIYNGPVAGWTPRISTVFSKFKQPEAWAAQHPRKDHTHVLVFCPNPNYGANNLRYAPLFVHYGSVVDPSVVPEFKPPVHWWPFTNGDLTNHGSAGAPAWAPPVSFTINSNGSWAHLQSQGLYALGTTLDCTKDFTLSFKIQRGDYLITNASGATEGFFTNSASASNGSLASNGGRFYLSGAAVKWNDPVASNSLYHCPTRLTITKRAADGYYLIYLDDQLVIEHTIAAGLLMGLTHFGKAGSSFLKTSTEFCDIRFYDYCMTPEQVKLMNG